MNDLDQALTEAIRAVKEAHQSVNAVAWQYHVRAAALALRDGEPPTKGALVQALECRRDDGEMWMANDLLETVLRRLRRMRKEVRS